MSFAVPAVATDAGAERGAARLVSLDVFRGLVMLLLIPNVHDGLSLRAMAAAHPQNPLWSTLARVFTHAQWSGCTIWDLIMPSFIFMVGVAMPYSYAARKRRGDSTARIYTHAALRAYSLVILGIELLTPVQTLADLLWPFVLLSLGLPVPEWIATTLRVRSPRAARLIEAAWWGGILCASTVRVFLDMPRFGLVLHDILPQLGLGYFFAFALVNRRRLIQASTAFAVLAVYWLAFFVYPLPPAGFDRASVGVLPTDQIYTGLFAHWNKGTNIAAAFDRWFLNLFPGPAPYVFTPQGTQTLTFVSVAVTMIFGIMAGEYLRSGASRARLRNRLLGAGACALGAGLLLGWTVCPIVKSLWTPSWTVYSAGWALIALGILYHAIDIKDRRVWVFPFVVVGLNPLLVYVLALHYGWWILEAWRRVVGLTTQTGYFGPMLTALACGLSLWIVAFVCHRMRLYVRI